MAVYTLFSKNAEILYKSRLLSKATLFVIVINLITIIFPFIIAYRSRGFWINYDIFYEQPEIKYTYDYLFIGMSDNSNELIICNTFSYFDIQRNLNKCNSIKVKEINENERGNIDEIEIKFMVDISSSKLTNFVLLLPIDVQLNTVCPLLMQSMIVIQRDVKDLFNTYKLAGDIVIDQKSPLPCKLNIRDNTYNTSAIGEKNNNIDLYEIFHKYLKRKVSTSLSNTYEASEIGKDGTFLLQLNLNIPESKIRYVPSFLQIMKWAWIQYIPVFSTIVWIMHKITSYVFQNNLILNFEIIPWKKNYFN